MKKQVMFCLTFVISIGFASEDKLEEQYLQKHKDFSPQEKRILEESKQQSSKQIQSSQGAKQTIKGSVVLKDPKKSQQGQDSLELSQSQATQAEVWGEEEKKREILFKKTWIYGTAVITTTFLDGSIKRSYGILLRDGMFVTSANMVYDQSIYARVSYAMMQDDSSLPFVCVAKLAIKALDLEKGLAILETSSFTDIYCNPRSESFYHKRIYSGYWVDVFNAENQNRPVVYSPYITKLNSFAVERHILQESLEQLAQKESNDFEGYKYAYGKGFYTNNGKLLGIIGASNDNRPRFIKAQEIADFLCELRERKILKNPFLQSACLPPQKEQN